MSDQRHVARVKLFQSLFAATFLTDTKHIKRVKNSKLDQLLTLIPTIDQELSQGAPERPLTEVNKVDLAILRLIMFESMQTDTPVKVLINEGVELAKTFGSESSSKFVNGVLGKLLIDDQKESTNE